MTLPAFGRATGAQIAMLSLAGYDLAALSPEIIGDDEARVRQMREGRRMLRLLTAQDHGYALRIWREHLLAYGDETGYTHPYAFASVDAAILRAAADPEFERVARLADAID